MRSAVRPERQLDRRRQRQSHARRERQSSGANHRAARFFACLNQSGYPSRHEIDKGHSRVETRRCVGASSRGSMPSNYAHADRIYAQWRGLKFRHWLQTNLAKSIHIVQQSGGSFITEPFEPMDGEQWFAIPKESLRQFNLISR
jgi:hypothetical protein